MDRPLANGSVPSSATGYDLPFSLEAIPPQMAVYNLSYKATHGATSITFSATTSLCVLPNQTNSSVTRVELHTGVLLAQPANGKLEGNTSLCSPSVFTQFDDCPTTDLSVIGDLKDQASRVSYIRPIPLFACAVRSHSTIRSRWRGAVHSSRPSRRVLCHG